MKLEITSHGETTEVELGTGTVTVGGTEKDGIQLAGLAERQVELRIDGERLMVVSRQTFTVDEVLSPAGVPRLVLAGERIGVSEAISLRQRVSKRSEEPGTAAVLKHLLAEVAAPDETRSASLTCLTGLDVGRRYPLAGAVAELGRGEDVQLRVRDRAVSRRHARIRRTAAGWTVEDLASPNGVYVNGKRIRRKAEIRDGDILELGHSLLRFRAPVEPPDPEPAPEPESAAAAQGTPGAEDAAAKANGSTSKDDAKSSAAGEKPGDSATAAAAEPAKAKKK